LSQDYCVRSIKGSPARAAAHQVVGQGSEHRSKEPEEDIAVAVTYPLGIGVILNGAGLYRGILLQDYCAGSTKGSLAHAAAHQVVGQGSKHRPEEPEGDIAVAVTYPLGIGVTLNWARPTEALPAVLGLSQPEAAEAVEVVAAFGDRLVWARPAVVGRGPEPALRA